MFVQVRALEAKPPITTGQIGCGCVDQAADSLQSLLCNVRPHVYLDYSLHRSVRISDCMLLQRQHFAHFYMNRTALRSMQIAPNMFLPQTLSTQILVDMYWADLRGSRTARVRGYTDLPQASLCGPAALQIRDFADP